MSASQPIPIVQWDYQEPNIQRDRYAKPSLQLTRLAVATASRGSIADSPAAYANSSFVLDFTAPAVQCQDVSPDILQPFNIASGCDHLRGEYDDASEDDSCEDLWSYIGWVPDSNSLVPFKADSIHNSSLPLEVAGATSRSGPTPSLRSPFYGGFQNDPVTLYVATRNQWKSATSNEWGVLNCSLFNASYVVNMTSDSNRRNHPTLLNVTMLNNVSDGTDTPHRLYGTPIPEVNKEIFSFLALMDSMGKLFLGTIFEAMRGSAPPQEFPYYNDVDIVIQPTEIMRTLLPFTTQLLPFITKIFDDGDPIDESQWTVIGRWERKYLNQTAAYPKYAADSPLFSQSLGTAIEQLFQNVSMSFFSEPAFVKDTDEDVEITILQSENVFSYDYTNLLLSYGIALGLSLCACIIGCISVWHNNVSYSNKFSTILRTTRGEGIETLVAPGDRSGADPLPKYLKKARIDLGLSRTSPTWDEGSQVELQQRFEQTPQVVSEESVSMDRQEDGEESREQIEPQHYCPEPDESNERRGSNATRAEDNVVHERPVGFIERDSSVPTSEVDTGVASATTSS